MMTPILNDLILIQEVSTGYVMTYKNPQGKEAQTKTFHYGQEAKMLNELIVTLNLKYDYQVTDRRTTSVST